MPVQPSVDMGHKFAPSAANKSIAAHSAAIAPFTAGHKASQPAVKQGMAADLGESCRAC